MELNDVLYDEVLLLSSKGDECSEASLEKEAIEYYRQALELLPEPKNDWEASTWLYGSMGDCFFSLKEYSEARNCFYEAFNCPEGVANPFILMRLGECLYELGNKKNAIEYLLRAYMVQGEEIFEYEDEKYFSLIEEYII